MTKKILYYTVLITGIVVCVVGLVSFISTYGKTTFTGIWGQVSGVICILGGIVNLIVASKVKKDIDRTETASETKTE